MAKKTAEEKAADKAAKEEKKAADKAAKDSAETTTDTAVPTPPGNTQLDHSPILETGTHLGTPAPTVNVAPQEVPQIINGVVVPRSVVTGVGHRHEFTRSLGRQTSQLSSKPTVAVRFSHPGLRAMVVRKFEHVNQAMEFLNNPNNAIYQPKYVDPDTVHGDELQETVTRMRHRESMPKKIQLIDAPIGSEKEFSDKDWDSVQGEQS